MDLVERVGSYVGLAAFLGLAVLALLYFSQARDVRRLRDWAGRAPERALEQIEQGTRGGAGDRGRARDAGCPRDRSTRFRRRRSRRRLRRASASRCASASATSTSRSCATSALAVARRAGAGGRRLRRDPADRRRRRRRAAGRAGVAASRGASGNRDRQRPVATSTRPQVTVAVLNGTTVQGLAAQVGEEVRAGGLHARARSATPRAIDQTTLRGALPQRPGSARRAQSPTGSASTRPRPVDSVNEEIAGSFDVIVLVGSDRGG